LAFRQCKLLNNWDIPEIYMAEKEGFEPSMRL